MSTAGQARSPELPDIERELARPGLKFRFANPAIENAYRMDRQARTGLSNRVALCLLTAIFDVFLLSEIKAAPELVVISTWMRFAVLTPAVAAFVLFDWLGWSKRWNTILVPLLLAAPTMISGVESYFAVSPSVIPAFQATPLLQLAVLTCRIGVLQALAANGTAGLIYAILVLTGPLVPPTMIPTLLLTDLSLFASTVVFAYQLDLRDRRVFLLGLQAEIRRDMLAGQNRMLAKLTQVDALTGLGNRRCFDETLATLWSQDGLRHLPTTLVLFDIDCFKLFNDRYGHQAGDECLVMVAREISRCLRDDRDTLVRHGGEEFAIILPNTSLELGIAVAERVRQAVSDRAIPHPNAGPAPYVTVTLGVASVTPAFQSAAVLIEAADRCLYAAKREGRNQVLAVQSGEHEAPQSPEFAAKPPPQAPHPSTLLQGPGAERDLAGNYLGMGAFNASIMHTPEGLSRSTPGTALG